jgi:subtilase family serine protease
MSDRFTLHPLEGSSQAPLPGAIVVGPSNLAERFEVSIVLRRRPDGPALPSPEEIGAQPPRMQQRITRDEFEASYGADPQDLEVVSRFATDHGLSISQASAARRTVTVTGTAAQFATAFSTNLQDYVHGGGAYRSYGSPLLLPAHLRPIVKGVLGLDNRPIAVPMARLHFRGWSAAQLEQSQAVAVRTARQHFQSEWDAVIARCVKTTDEDPDIREYIVQYARWAWMATFKGSWGDNLRIYLKDVLPSALRAQPAWVQAQNRCQTELCHGWAESIRVATLAGLDELDIKTPPRVASLYGFPEGTDGSGQCIGIIELGGGFWREDVARYFEFLDIPPPDISYVGVSGGTNNPGANGPYDGEVCLDIEVIGGAAPGAKIVCYFAPLTAQGFIEAVHTAIHDRENRPSALSISWALSERFWLETPMHLDCFEEVLKEAAVLGVSVCCAAGDYGSSTLSSDGRAWVEYPASSPYVLGCGGTSLYSRSNFVLQEIVWNTAKIFYQATGGGVSQLFRLPKWQESADVPKSVNPGGGPGRGVPDVAANADPATGYIVQANGKSTVMCGTSAGAPLWAALLARISQSLGVPVGYINPYLYQSVNHERAFRDIVLGGNGVYFARKGWDACTGWGVPRGTELHDALGAKQV